MYTFSTFSFLLKLSKFKLMICSCVYNFGVQLASRPIVLDCDDLKKKIAPISCQLINYVVFSGIRFEPLKDVFAFDFKMNGKYTVL